MDLHTQDERALQLAPTLLVTLVGKDFTVWVNPESGTSCRVELSGDYEVTRLVRRIPKPAVLGQIHPQEAAQLLRDPHAERTRRAVAHSIVAVDAVS